MLHVVVFDDFGWDEGGTRYNETWLLRTLKGNEKRYVLNKVRFIQKKESAKKSDWRYPRSTERT